ncbi:MAG: AAA family ATPase [Bacteroidales bacterium]|nr:AAA family ATPase [Bacteroidales bacterium]
MFKRNIYTELERWKTKKHRKPLILRGARQVGKTTLIKMFSETYSQSIILNLENNKDRTFFEKTDDIKEIVESIFVNYNIDSGKEPILLFIDEIQESPEAIRMLRYFLEKYPEIHVIAAGSLLEFALSEVKSFPVGRVEYLYLHPLNFIEFIGAIQHTQALKQIEQIPVNKFAHDTLLELYNNYVITGGMPEVVKVYAENKSMLNLSDIYESLWSSYQDDAEKYASNDTEKKTIKHIMDVAHLSIDKRIKFHNFGNSNYRSREVGEAMRSLDAAQIIQLIYPATVTEPPIQANFKKSPRLQFLDTGLLNYSLGIQAEMIGMNDLSNSYKGAIIPHIVTQELIALNNKNKQKPHFWVREKMQASSEVDLIINCKNLIIPVKIKSGSTGSLRSLHEFINRSEHKYVIRIYAGEFKIEEQETPARKKYTLMNMPYYLSSKIYEYAEYFIDNF